MPGHDDCVQLANESRVGLAEIYAGINNVNNGLAKKYNCVALTERACRDRSVSASVARCFAPEKQRST